MAYTPKDRTKAPRLLHLHQSQNGKPLEGFVAYVAPKRQNGFGKEWFAMSQSASEMLALSKLSGDDHRLLRLLEAKLDFENLLVVNQRELAGALGMQASNVNRSIKRLVQFEVLLEGPRIGVSRSYRLNPYFGWKGSAKNHKAAMEAERQQRMKAAGITGVIDGGPANQSADDEQGSLL